MPVTDPTEPMTQEARDAAHAASEPAPAPPPSPAARFQQVLDQLNHPGNLDLPSRMHALEQAVRVMIAVLMPTMPTE